MKKAIYRMGVLSDTHGQHENIAAAIKKMGKIDAIYFLGDFVMDMDSFKKRIRVPIICVKGNCDMMPHEKSKVILNNYGIKTLLTHGHKYRVKMTMTRLGLEAQAGKYDLICFGHTHTSKIKQSGRTTFFNPGACCGLKPTYGIVEIEDGIIKPTVYSLYE